MTITLNWTTLQVMSIALVLSNAAFTQDKRKHQAPQQSLLRRLHPDLVESDPPKGIRLLGGYKHKSTTDFEGNQVGEIFMRNGVTIKYEIGLSQGMAVDINQKAKYVWFREQKTGDRIVRYALNKGNVFIISIPLDDAPGTLHVANFYGRINKRQDIADMLLMIMAFVTSD